MSLVSPRRRGGGSGMSDDVPPPPPVAREEAAEGRGEVHRSSVSPAALPPVTAPAPSSMSRASGPGCAHPWRRWARSPERVPSQPRALTPWDRWVLASIPWQRQGARARFSRYLRVFSSRLTRSERCRRPRQPCRRPRSRCSRRRPPRTRTPHAATSGGSPSSRPSFGCGRAGASGSMGLLAAGGPMGSSKRYPVIVTCVSPCGCPRTTCSPA